MPGINKKIKGCRFHHLSMRVRDLDASIKFYTEGLGFVERFSWGEASKRTVLLDTGDGNYFEISQGDPEKVYGDGVFHHIALRADDCGAALEAARARAHRINHCRGYNRTNCEEMGIPNMDIVRARMSVM